MKTGAAGFADSVLLTDGHSGHSAVEDSEAALELVRFKMKQTLASGR